MAFFEKLGDKLGEGAGKGINNLFGVLFELFVHIAKLALTIAWKGIVIFFLWFIAWEKETTKTAFVKANNLRIAVVGIIFSCITIPGLLVLPTWNLEVPNLQSVLGAKSTQQQPRVQIQIQPTVAEVVQQVEPVQQPEAPPQQTALPPQVEAVVEVPETTHTVATEHVTNLATETFEPALPDAFLFTVTTEERQEIYEEAGWAYIRYQSLDGNMPQVTVDAQTCVIVPAGKSALVKTTRPPRFAFNMQDSVGYVSKNNDTQGTATWSDIHKDWDEVETETHGLLVKALPKRSIPSPSLGGMACF